MTNETQAEGKKQVMETHKSFFEAARKMLLASVGAISLAQDEMEDFVKKLVERGEIAEKEGRSLVHEIREKRKERMKKAEDEITSRVAEALSRMNMPNKGDIDKLGKKIAILEKKVDDLKKTQS